MMFMGVRAYIFSDVVGACVFVCSCGCVHLFKCVCVFVCGCKGREKVREVHSNIKVSRGNTVGTISQAINKVSYL